MAIANKKFAGLPDLDLETYIYETPELTDDTSTVQTGTIRTNSATPSDVSSDRDDIDRTRLNQDTARTRFERSKIDANDVNFSDSLASNRRSYKVSRRRRRRRRDNGTEEIGDLTESEDEEETLSAKLARLRREAEEVQSELERRKEAETADEKKVRFDGKGQESKQSLEDGVTELSRLLNGLYSTSSVESPAEARLSEQLANSFTKPPVQQKQPVILSSTEATLPPPTTPSPEALNAIADLSSRLTNLEEALGLQSMSTFSPETPLAILPTLASLSSQMITLSSTLSPPPQTSTNVSSTIDTSSTNPALDDLSHRIHTLTTESNSLIQSRTRAAEAAFQLAEERANASANGAPPPPAKASDTTTATTMDDDLADQADQITSLYRLLPTIESFSPLLPLVLDRLRALRDVHAGAADVKGELEDVRNAQERLAQEIDRWRAVLEGVEGKCEEGEERMKRNVEVVGGWVRGLEGKVEKLG
ncbi:MAG: hypothetical protein Q9160_008885 [Pyrenula sp. 1 TL-2023]